MLLAALESRRRVRVEGLGTFLVRGDGSYGFEEEPRREVFIAYVEEDSEQALRLYRDLRDAGLHPWMDKRNLLPGQLWVRAVERAIQRADFFVALFSARALRKRGQFQSELRFALQCARKRPLEESFVIPARLEPCQVPLLIAGECQWVDLFPDWVRGVDRIVEAATLPSDPTAS